MFAIELSLDAKPWFPIWQTQDGADAAAYLKQLVEYEEATAALATKKTRREYRLIFSPAQPNG